MTRSLPRIWAGGMAIIVAAQLAWFLSLGTQTFSQTLFALLWASSGIAAFFVSFLSPRGKVAMGLSLAVPAAMLIALLNYGYQLIGHASDFPGLRGAMLLFAIALAWNGAICGIGTAAGYLLSRTGKR